MKNFFELLGLNIGPKRIDYRFAKVLGWRQTRNLKNVAKTFPGFRFPDFHRAAEHFLRDKKTLATIHSSHYEPLSSLTGTNSYGEHRLVNPAPTQLVSVGWKKEEQFPSDCFWVFEDPTSNVLGILRIKSNLYSNIVQVELAANSESWIQKMFGEIIEASSELSVYRNHLLNVRYEEAISEEDGEVQTPQQLTVSFCPAPEISSDDIVLAPDIESVLQRNVVSFHQNRAQLSELGLPLRRGILLHGPPGTGKTYTCQYLFGQMQPVTMLVAAGKSLTQLKSICNLARMLKPCVVVLEDVDLIFASREISLYSTGLGELMDELDGFQRDEAVIFILTTNAIERLEAAIKDRPGRISQCVFMGPPNEELRARYLRRFLRDYDCTNLSIPDVARLSEGGSHAFLQELVYRAVQIAAETTGPDEVPRLKTADFEEAMQEMTSHSEQASANIIGFRQNRLGTPLAINGQRKPR